MVSRIDIAPYEGNNTLVKRLRNLVSEKYSHLFVAVIVHGSVATDEVISYSDFDGLLILRKSLMATSNFKKFKLESSKLIEEFDPLQHHGWFVIPVEDFDNYDPRILPVDVLEYAKAVYPKEGLGLDIQLMQSPIDWHQPAANILRSVEGKMKRHYPPKGMFNLKSWLSEVMLIPALIYQAREEKGIFKKQSFSVMKNLYSPEAWRAIEIASNIRVHWHYKFWVPRKIFTSLKNKKGFKKPVRNHLAPTIPAPIQLELQGGFKQALGKLIEESKILISPKNRSS